MYSLNLKKAKKRERYSLLLRHPAYVYVSKPRIKPVPRHRLDTGASWKRTYSEELDTVCRAGSRKIEPTEEEYCKRQQRSSFQRS